MFKSLYESFKKHRAFVKTYNQLSKLSTHELNDIGIEKSMITRIALEAACGKDYKNA